MSFGRLKSPGLRGVVGETVTLVVVGPFLLAALECVLDTGEHGWLVFVQHVDRCLAFLVLRRRRRRSSTVTDTSADKTQNALPATVMPTIVPVDIG